MIDIQYILYDLIAAAVLLSIGWLMAWTKYRELLDKKDKQRENFQRSVLKGKISEQIAPYLPNFPKDLNASEARFLGSPIDFVVFKGMDDKNISEVVFVEVKSGREHFNANENSLRDAILQKRVRYETYHVDSEVFNKQ